MAWGRAAPTLRRPLPRSSRGGGDDHHRYVHNLPVQTAREWEREALWCQMRELNQVLDYQNKILVEILAALDRLTRAVGEMGETG